WKCVTAELVRAHPRPFSSWQIRVELYSAQICHLMSSLMENTTRRPYDARRRRQRAQEERQATRRRVVEAARQLFLTRGYVATTMADVAREAGVALQSVYTAGQSKADLLHLVADVAVAGDHPEGVLPG